MLMTILIVAGALAEAQTATPAVPAAPATTVAGRTLKDLPNTIISYYDVQGRNGAAIEKSLKKVLADRASANMAQFFKWDVRAQSSKRTQGEKCTIESAKLTLTASVSLPRLAEEAKAAKDVISMWQSYVTGVEGDAAANLWFINDRLPGIERSMVGLSCDQGSSRWSAGMAELKAQLAQFAAQRLAAANLAAAKPPAQ